MSVEGRSSSEEIAAWGDQKDSRCLVTYLLELGVVSFQ